MENLGNLPKIAALVRGRPGIQLHHSSWVFKNEQDLDGWAGGRGRKLLINKLDSKEYSKRVLVSSTSVPSEANVGMRRVNKVFNCLDNQSQMVLRRPGKCQQQQQ